MDHVEPSGYKSHRIISKIRVSRKNKINLSCEYRYPVQPSLIIVAVLSCNTSTCSGEKRCMTAPIMAVKETSFVHD